MQPGLELHGILDTFARKTGMFTDTHAHLYEASFAEDWDQMVLRLRENGVDRVFLPNVDSGTAGPLKAVCDKDPDLFYPLMGLHPCSVKADFEDELEKLHAEFPLRKYYAVGEIGIDLYWDKTFFAEQQQAFIRQVEWANAMDLPIVIHSRESIPQIIDLLQHHTDCRRKGIFHCFTGTEEEARTILGMGYYLGIGGVVTFKNSHLPELLKKIGPERLVLETDSPYLAPAPHRGKRNESAYVRLVAEKLATLFSLDLQEIAAITTRNASDVFRV